MFDIRVIQRQPGPVAACGDAVWRTCVREIAFVDEATETSATDHEFAGEDAYAHLLSVICGLRSPITGETQVMQQFRAFVAGVPRHLGWLRTLGQQLLADAGEIRTRHLIGSGPQSYGSAIRRRIRDCDRAAMIGTGMLAREILPYLNGGNRPVDLWGRRIVVDLAAPSVIYRRIGTAVEPNAPAATALILAAPIAAADTDLVVRQYASLALVIDLRGEAAHDPMQTSVPVVTLSAIFEDLQAAARALQSRVGAAEEEVRRRARAFALRDRPRPSGWHDLCA